MKDKARQLFWEIINCPNANKEHSSCCSDVLCVQKGYPFRQVPEPWSGRLDSSPVLIIGSNPAFVEEEVLPAKDSGWSGWASIFPNGPEWNDSMVEAFFENRFHGAACPGTTLPYVDLSSGTTLRKDKQGQVAPVRFQNNYWGTYEKYCEIIVPGFSPYSFVVTDFVHCKSAKEIGVNSAMRTCLGHMKRILEVFLSNDFPIHEILLFGKDSDAKKKLEVLESIGLIRSSSAVSVGSYLYKRGIKRGVDPIRHVIFKQPYSFIDVPVNVYYNLPAPSGSNRAASPAVINGKSISW